MVVKGWLISGPGADTGGGLVLDAGDLAPKQRDAATNLHKG